MPKSFEAGSFSPAPLPERRGAKPVGRRDILKPRLVANDIDGASNPLVREPSDEARERVQSLRKSNAEHRARKSAEAEAKRAEEERLAAEAEASRQEWAEEEARRLEGEKASRAARVKERRERMSERAKQDVREAAAKIRAAHRGLEEEKRADVGVAAKEISAYFLNAEALRSYARDLAKVAETALDTNELAMPDGRPFPVEWTMADVRSLAGRLDIEVALKKEREGLSQRRSEAIGRYDAYARDYQGRKSERSRMMDDVMQARDEWEEEGERRAWQKRMGDVDQPRADVDSRQLADEVDFVPESDREARDESRRRSLLEASVRRLEGELEAAKLDLAEARKSQGLGAKVGAFFRRFGATPNAADEAMGQLEADVRMKENALEKAQRDLQDLRSRKAGGDVDLDDALYARGEQAKMVAHDVLSAVAVAPKGWSKRSIDRARADRRGQPTAELDGRGYGGASRVGMPERAADAVYDVPETTTVEDHVASSEDAAKVLGKEAVEKLMQDLDHAAEILEARADGGEKSMQDAVEELGRMDFSPNRYAKLTADLYEAVVKAGPKERVMSDPEVKRLTGEIVKMNELLAKGGALHGNPADRFFQG